MKIAIKPGGPGFCNRVFSWECIYEIAKLNNVPVVCNWEELKYLYFPNTYYEDNFNLKEFVFFNSNDKSLVNNNFLFTNRTIDYMAVCGFGFNRHFEETHYKEKKSPKQQIKLKDSDLEEKINLSVKDAIGVHIRRGDYRKSKEFIISSCICLPDSWYINLMNQYKSKYGDIKFYISSDAEKDMLKVFYDNFDIIDCENIVGGINKKMSYNARLSCSKEDLIDLFALGKTKEIICSVSTWSMFAYQTNNKPHIWPENENQSINSIRFWDIKR